MRLKNIFLLLLNLNSYLDTEIGQVKDRWIYTEVKILRIIRK